MTSSTKEDTSKQKERELFLCVGVFFMYVVTMACFVQIGHDIRVNEVIGYEKKHHWNSCEALITYHKAFDTNILDKSEWSKLLHVLDVRMVELHC